VEGGYPAGEVPARAVVAQDALVAAAELSLQFGEVRGDRSSGVSGSVRKWNAAAFSPICRMRLPSDEQSEKAVPVMRTGKRPAPQSAGFEFGTSGIRLRCSSAGDWADVSGFDQPWLSSLGCPGMTETAVSATRWIHARRAAAT